MLILSRKAEQTILSIQDNRVKIGLDAPDSVRILRGELESFGEPLGSQPDGEDVVKSRPLMAP